MNHSHIASWCALNPIAIFVYKNIINEVLKCVQLTVSQCQLFFNKKRCRIGNIFDDIIIGPIISSIFVINFVAIILRVWYNILVQKSILCVRWFRLRSKNYWRKSWWASPSEALPAAEISFFDFRTQNCIRTEQRMLRRINLLTKIVQERYRTGALMIRSATL